MEPAFVALVMAELQVVLSWFPNRFPALLELCERTVRTLNANQLGDLDKYAAHQEVGVFSLMVSYLG